jgi:hypothetical protein
MIEQVKPTFIGFFLMACHESETNLKDTVHTQSRCRVTPLGPWSDRHK